MPPEPKSAVLPRVLLVDDEAHVTRGLAMLLRKEYAVTTANSGTEGLARLDEEPTFAVIVSDMRMPEMSGAEFLSRARQRSPDATRILLTGQTDVASAIAAINEGRILRFLTKPCTREALAGALHDGVEQHRLVTAERELLQQTLVKSLQVLMDMLTLVQPAASAYSARMRQVVAHVARGVGVVDPWRVHSAAMLCQLGCLSLSPDLLQKAHAGQSLDAAEERAFRGHPALGAELLGGIPRLEGVAAMIARQLREPAPDEVVGAPATWDPVVLGGEILRLANAYLTAHARSPHEALARLERSAQHAPALVGCLAGFVPGEVGTLSVRVDVDRLREGMILAQDLRAKSGVILAAEGLTVTVTLLKLVKNFIARGELVGNVLARIPGTTAASSPESGQAA